MANGIPLSRQQAPYRVHIKHHRSPGDALVTTTVVRALKLAGYRVSVDTGHPAIWQNNPDVEPLPAHLCHIVDIRSEYRPGCGHYAQFLADEVGAQLGTTIRLEDVRPVLRLTDAERDKKLVAGDKPYVVLNAGHKTDFTVKHAGWGFYQSLVSKLNKRFRVVQVGSPDDIHQPLKGAVNMIGKTPDQRDLFSLVCNSVGGIGGVTFLGHVHAALGRPYVCLAGGREEEQWIGYPTQKTFSAVGSLPCCSTGGCWRARTVPLNDGNPKDMSLCELPVVNRHGDTVPKCQEIDPQVVVNALTALLNPS